MRIAFIIVPPERDGVFGGHNIQMQKTRQYLEKLGLHITVTGDARSLRYGEYDLLHHWSPDRTAFDATASNPAARVLSPIYHSRSVRLDFAKDQSGRLNVYGSMLRSTVAKKVKRGLGLIRGAATEENILYALHRCDLFIPNSESEARAIYSDTRVHTPYYVAPNAVDMSFRNARPDTFVDAYGLRDFVVCVGRIEPYKNQLRLIEALRGSGLKLVLIGKPHPHHPDYFARCKAHFGADVVHIPHIPYEELSSAYAAARVSVLPSYYETTGLVSLEAGLVGINVVTTERGYTREYFEDLAWYCNPADTQSIRQAVLAAWNTPFTNALQQRIEQFYTWSATAERTLEAYQRALSLKKRSDS